MAATARMLKGSPGDLRHRLVLQEKRRTADSGGGASVAWADVASFWANVAPVGQFMRLQSEQLQSRLTHEVTTRRRDDILPGMRLNFGGRFLMVRTITAEDERLEFLKVMCEETKES